MRLYEMEPYATFLNTLPTLGTRKSYHSPLSFFHIFLNGKSPLEATPDDVLRYFATRKHRSVSTQALNQAVLISFYRSLVKRRLITTNPAEILQGMVKTREKNPQPLSKEHREALLGSLNDSLDNERLLHRALVVLLGMHEGMRIGEMAQIRYNNFDFAPGSKTPFGIVKFIGKGSKERTIPLTERVRQAVLRLQRLSAALRAAEGQPPDKLVFRSKFAEKPVSQIYLSNLFHEQEAIAQIPLVSVHKLRHTFGTILAESGASVYTIRDLMGHSSIAISEHYVKLVPGVAQDAHLLAFGGMLLKAV